MTEIYDQVVKRIYQSYNKYLKEVFGDVLVHHLMLRDYIRISKFREAIQRHSRDRIVLDLGTGSGILAILAAKAGAKRVHAIEETTIIELAKELAVANSVADKIQFYHSNSLETSVSEPVDVVIAEILGNDPFSEGIVPYVLDAKRRFMSQGGVLIPFKVELHCLGVESQGNYVHHLDAALAEASVLEDLYNLNFEPYKRRIASIDNLVDTVPQDQFGTKNRLLTADKLVKELDFFQADASEFVTEATLAVTQAGMLNALAIYFRAFLDHDITLCTSPWHPRTCWEIKIFRTRQPIRVEPGQSLHLSVHYDGHVSSGVSFQLLGEACTECCAPIL